MDYILGGNVINNKKLILANAENKIRLNILKKVSLKFSCNKYHVLLEKIKNCEKEHPCNSLACSMCINGFQQKIINELFNVLGGDYVFVTLIYYRDKIPVNKLSSFKLYKFKDKLRKKLKAIGFTNPILGSFEIDLHLYTNKEKSYYLPHFHLLMPNEKEKLNELRDYMKSNSNLQGRLGIKNRPMLVKKINDLEGVIRYITKFTWCEIAFFSNKEGKIKHSSKRRISNSRMFADSLVKLDTLKLSDLIFKLNFQ